MRNLRDEDLILYYYGESPNAARIRQQLDASAEARQRYEDLCQTLALVEETLEQEQAAPQVADDYGKQVWQKIAPQLAANQNRRGSLGDLFRSWLVIVPQPFAMAGVALALVLVAFLAGRYSYEVAPGDVRPEVNVASETFGQERVLWVTVEQHLERSEMLLVALTNSAGAEEVYFDDEVQRAKELLVGNRLYRQVAQRTDQKSLADVLEELERLLLELAHSPSQLSTADFNELQQSIEQGDLLFRVRVVGSRLDSVKKNPAPPVARGEV